MSPQKKSLTCSIRGATKKPGANKTTAALRFLGLWGKRSYERHIPAQYLWNSVENRQLLLQGLCDTDGYVVTRWVEYCTSSEQLAKDIQFLVKSLGGRATYKRKKTHYVQQGKRIVCRDSYRMSLLLPDGICPVRHNVRKPEYLSFSSKQGQLKQNAIVSIDPCGRAECQCISVEDSSGLYVTDDFIVTHNSAYGAGDVILSQDPKDEILVFSLEMSGVVLIQRMIANKANVNFRKLIDNDCDTKEKQRVREAMKYLNKTNVLIDDTPCLTPDQFWDKCQEHPDAKMIIVDHLHLMRHDRGDLTDVKALDDICQQIREYAKTRNVPIILIAQLNRNPEDRESHEPILADLRGSGGIEQDSDIVLLLFRPAYYLQREISYDEEDDGDATIIVAKQRNGICGKIRCLFIGPFMSWRDSPDETMNDWT